MKNCCVILILLLVMLLCGPILVSCRDGGKYITKVGMVWNTTYHITYQGAEELGDSITATLTEVGCSVNFFDSTSIISCVNANLTDSMDTHLSRILVAAKRIHVATDGAFDPTLGPLITAWGFGKGHEATADTAHIDSLMHYVGLDKVHISGMRIIKDNPAIEMNLSAIAKGYGCDAVAEMLRRNGVQNYMIEIGGEIAVGGKSPRGGDWLIAIDTPVYTDSIIHSAVATVMFSNAGMATSGNYRNFKESGGVRFGHTLNPRTGRPARTDVLSATIIAGNAMEADAYATACMVLGYERSRVLVDSLRLAALLVRSDHSVWYSAVMSKYLIHD